MGPGKIFLVCILIVIALLFLLREIFRYADRQSRPKEYRQICQKLAAMLIKERGVFTYNTLSYSLNYISFESILSNDTGLIEYVHKLSPYIVKISVQLRHMHLQMPHYELKECILQRRKKLIASADFKKDEIIWEKSRLVEAIPLPEHIALR